MKKRLSLLAAAALAAAVAVTLLAATGGAQQPAGRTIGLIEREGTFGFVDNRPRSPDPSFETRRARVSVGDVFAGSGRLYDAASPTRRLGTFHFTCTVTVGGRLGREGVQCTGAMRLADGILTLAVGGRLGRTIAAPVTGGTGAYEGAEGTAVSTETRRGSRWTIRLLP
jgi:hypothetical protein